MTPTHYRDPRFECPRWPLAADLLWLAALVKKGSQFLALPIKTRRHGPAVHWKTRDRIKVEERYGQP